MATSPAPAWPRGDSAPPPTPAAGGRERWLVPAACVLAGVVAGLAVLDRTVAIAAAGLAGLAVAWRIGLERLVRVHLVLSATLGRTWAHVGIALGSVGMFVTELALAVGLAHGLRAAGVRRLVRFAAPALPLLVLATATSVVSLTAGRPPGAVLRDAASYAHALFMAVGATLALTAAGRRSVVRTFTLAAVLVAGLGLLNSLTGGGSATSTGVARYLAGSSAIALVAALAALVLVPGHLPSWVVRARWPVGLALAAALLAVQHRSAFLAVAASVATVVVLSERRSRRVVVGAQVAAVAIFACCAVAAAWDVLPDGYARDTAARVATVLNPSDDPNASARLRWWALVGQAVARSPAVGYGFGVGLGTHAGIEGAFRPHNSYVLLAYQTGLVGLAAALFALLLPIRRTVARLRSLPAEDRAFVRWTAATLVFVLAFAAFNVVLATPYMGCLTWVLAGLPAGVLTCRGGAQLDREPSARTATSSTRVSSSAP